MTVQPHETSEFRNAVEYTVAITFRVAGGVRHGTADRRAIRIAEHLASAAARTAGVVEVTARSGPSTRGETSFTELVRFDAANTGPGISGVPGRLARYVDQDFELGLRSLAAADAAYRQRRRADEGRRRAVGCANAHPSLLEPTCAPCECVYCLPDEHAAGRRDGCAGDRWLFQPRCLCGVPVPAEGGRCLAHRGVRLVLVEADAQALVRLAETSDRTPDTGLDR